MIIQYYLRLYYIWILANLQEEIPISVLNISYQNIISYSLDDIFIRRYINTGCLHIISVEDIDAFYNVC